MPHNMTHAQAVLTRDLNIIGPYSDWPRRTRTRRPQAGRPTGARVA